MKKKIIKDKIVIYEAHCRGNSDNLAISFDLICDVPVSINHLIFKSRRIMALNSLLRFLH